MAYDADYEACCKRKARQNVSAFAALIASPATGSFVLPAGARLSFVATAGAAAGATLATLTSSTVRTIKAAKLMAAGDRQVLDYAERAVTVDPVSGVDVYIDSGLNVWKKVCEG